MKTEPAKTDNLAAKVRILIVDDSALMRKFLTEILSAEPSFEVIGTARDGEDALEKTRRLKPDVITLDVEMPRMNGIAFLETLMREIPTRVVMVSSLTMEGAETTLTCLRHGAIDFVAKPSGSISLDLGDRSHEIVTKVKIAAQARLRPLGTQTLPATTLLPASPVPIEELACLQRSTEPFSQGVTRPQVPPAPRKMVVVAIAASTGGPAALHEFLPRLPGDLNAAYLLVQHMPTGFTKPLADRLNSDSALTVREAQEGDRPQRGVVLVAQGGLHLELDAQGRIRLHQDPPLWGVRPAADVMMRSVASFYGSRTIGVVMTGMGRDGAMGAKAIHQAGGICLAQDENTSIIYGMPRMAVETGAVERELPLSEMADYLAQRIRTLTEIKTIGQAA